jgi:O-antigen/teichoic acid export membrane protein
MYSAGEYGEVVSLFTLSAVLGAIFDFGLPLFLQRETSLFVSRATELFSKAFTTALIIMPLYFAVIITSGWILYPTISIWLVLIVSGAIYVSVLVNICNKSLSALNDFRSQFTALWISRLYILIFFAAGMFYLYFDINSLMAVMLIGFFLNLLLLFWYLHKKNVEFTLSHFNFLEMKGILKLSAPLGLAVVFNFMYDKIDIILLSKMKDFSEAGYYNAAYGIYKSLMLSYSFILAAGFTRISKLSRSKRAADIFFRKYFLLILIIAAVTAVATFFLAGSAIRIIYTNKFQPSVPVLQILSVALIGNAMNNLTGIILNGIGLFKAVMYITLFGLIVNIALNFAFIPVYGAHAAAYVTVITEYFIFFFELYYVIRVLKAKAV